MSWRSCSTLFKYTRVSGTLSRKSLHDVSDVSATATNMAIYFSFIVDFIFNE